MGSHPVPAEPRPYAEDTAPITLKNVDFKDGRVIALVHVNTSLFVTMPAKELQILRRNGQTLDRIVDEIAQQLICQMRRIHDA